MKKYTFVVYGRPKDKEFDKTMAKINKDLNDMLDDHTLAVQLHMPLTSISFEVSEDEPNLAKKIKEFRAYLFTLYSKSFIDVRIEEKE